jgi:hypothetical protein
MLALVYIYMWTASSGGVRDLLYAVERTLPPKDLYAHAEHYHLHLFEEMFFPSWVEAGRGGEPPPPRRSLVVFTSGRLSANSFGIMLRNSFYSIVSWTKGLLPAP